MLPNRSSGHPEPNLEEHLQLARSFVDNCNSSQHQMSQGAKIFFAQFPGTPNEDRYTISGDWELLGHIWQFIAVFDGHGGSTTADYLARHFSSHLRRSMDLSFKSYPPVSESKSSMKSFQNDDTPPNVFTENAVSVFLKREVRAFDEGLGDAVKKICPHPESLSDKEAQALYEAHKDIIARARCGSTMAGILIDQTEHRIWVCCVGDSSVALSTQLPRSDKRKSILLNKHHNGQTPQEYHRVSMGHPSQERENIWLDGKERIFGGLNMTRAFGDFMYKFPTSFTTTLFSKLPFTAMKSIERVLTYNRTPPYVIPDPFITFVDLTAFSKDEDPAVVIYTDGLEALANGLSIALNKTHSGHAESFSSESRSSDILPTAVDIIGGLLGHPIDHSTLSSNLNYIDVFPKNNAAFDLMYNLFSKAIPDKLKAHLSAAENHESRTDIGDIDEELYIDDVTVIVFRPFMTQ